MQLPQLLGKKQSLQSYKGSPCFARCGYGCRSSVLDRCVLLVPLAAGLVNFNQQVFDILDFTFYRLCLVPQLPVPPFEAVQLLLQRIQLCPFSLAIPAIR